MPTILSHGFADRSAYPVMLKAIAEAKEAIYVMTFVFKTAYEEDNLPREIADALKAAAARGVKVYVLLNYSRSEPDVREMNYRIGAELAAAGCRVRLGPKDVTLHTKMLLVDGKELFLGSHNLTRGAMTRNREFTIRTRSLTLIHQLNEYFVEVWEGSTRIGELPSPSEEGKPVQITLTQVVEEGEAVRLDFTVNHVYRVEGFAAGAAKSPDLTTAAYGAFVAPTERTVTVIPQAEPGETIYVAVCGYTKGQLVASSSLVQMPYRPQATPPSARSAPALAAPQLTELTRTAPATVTVEWVFAGAGAFDRFEVQQRDLRGTWNTLAVISHATTREWTGTPLSMDATFPFRIAVYDTAGESAVSGEVVLKS